MTGEVRPTVTGAVSGVPQLRYLPSGRAAVRFCVAVRTQVYDREAAEWLSGEEFRYLCTAQGPLAERAADSLADGVRVVVTGRLEFKVGLPHLSVEDIGVSLRSRLVYVGSTYPLALTRPGRGRRSRARAGMASRPGGEPRAPCPPAPPEGRTRHPEGVPCTRPSGHVPGWLGDYYPGSPAQAAWDALVGRAGGACAELARSTGPEDDGHSHRIKDKELDRDERPEPAGALSGTASGPGEHGASGQACAGALL
ncbi:single-stranded DNA-binding protein [Streptomyces sp. 891-h]|uniref:single-stranded DNA-binding protein n=1 Tax=Streptomyces sp. 891-h TaxID=2720714 RepID=UPI001FAAABB7|nr:single-stranded DNA-binding protein [Streptomyces sp. 891-h]UNZ21414.1 single-stranded DNA-binding protein [Streptomyces sp. 891-h]